MTYLLTSTGRVLPHGAAPPKSDPVAYWCAEGDAKWTPAADRPPPHPSRGRRAKEGEGLFDGEPSCPRA